MGEPVWKKLRLATLGVVVVPRQQWPVINAGGPAREIQFPVGTVFSTSQDAVWHHLAQEKIDRLRAGEALHVNVVLGRQSLWVFDGHHTLAAYLLLGWPVLARRATQGPDRIVAPHLFARPRARPDVAAFLAGKPPASE